MFRRIRESELVRVLALIQTRARVYLAAIVIERIIDSIFLNVILAFILKDMLDAAIQGKPSLVIRALVLASSAFLVGVPSVCILRYISGRCIRKAMTDIRMKIFSHIGDLPISHFEHQHTGNFISRMTNDLETMEEIYSRHIRTLIFALVFGCIAMITIFMLDWCFGILVLSLGLITVFVNTIFASPLRRLSDMMQKHWGTLTERLMDLLQGLYVIKMLHIEEVIHQFYTRTNEEMSTSTIKHGHLSALFNVTNYLFGNVIRTGLLALGLFMLLEGFSIEVGTIAAIIHLQGNADFMFSNIGRFITRIQHSLAGASRVLELLDSPIEPRQYIYPEEHKVPSIEHASAMVEMRNVTFGYEEDKSVNAIALHDINIRIAEGQVAVLVGPSGGGKSTITKLLLGFYPLNRGNIIIDGKPIGQWPLTLLRSMIAYVPQDVYLFTGTIEENIGYGRPDATKDEIISAARSANAHDFIMDQPNGYDTLVGERGAKLSVGQRQRITIAKALLKEAPILLVDEATSALDTESAQLVQEALEVLMKGRTTIAITHRLSTINHADVIYVVDDGRIVEQGKHNELMANKGLYKRLYELQFRLSEVTPTGPASSGFQLADSL